ncbi:MAG: hypothetical protein JWM40_283 [Frankiales bacterium]|nr:hypothetical protein [Frankiales bacterium]
MKRLVVAVVLLCVVAGCSSGNPGGATDSTKALCRFSSPPLTTGAQARQMAADIQQVMPKSSLNDPRNLRINKAVLTLMVAAGSTIPTGPEDQGPDPALIQAIQAQGALAAACA